MRYLLPAIVLLVIAPASADSYPERKPGLWQYNIETSQGAQSMKQCIDAATDAVLMQMSQGVTDACSKHELHQEGDSYIGESDCVFANSRTVTKSVTTGDFSSGFVITAISTRGIGTEGESKSSMTVKATWLGPCEAGQNPGDVIMPGGASFNLLK